MAQKYNILIDCSDDKGLIYKITDLIYSKELNIVLNREFVDRNTNHFFMKTVVQGKLEPDDLQKQLTTILPENSNVRILSPRKKKVVLLATKEHHVLGNLLIKNEFSEINAEIRAVISNHEVLRPLVEKFNIPFHFVPHEGVERSVHEERIRNEIDKYVPEYLILAKYMRILTPGFIQDFRNRIINIHHSFLPAFVGAKPYQQAFNRGVKIIGATAHFVNEALDEGPIITQSTSKIDHSHDAKDMAYLGKEIESRVLAEALDLVFEDKVFIHGNKTVVLN